MPVQVVDGPAGAHGMLLLKVVCRICGKSAVDGHSADALMSWPSPKAIFDSVQVDTVRRSGIDKRPAGVPSEKLAIACTSSFV